jgi:hypothetical protein
LLLHGTDPRHLQSILFEGLLPNLARDELFGRGTYFAESGAKIDCNAHIDRKWSIDDKGLQQLHGKLYQEQKQLHPKHIYYALVCRVLLGRTVHTDTTHDDAIFEPNSGRSALARDRSGGKVHSLVAEKGAGANHPAREFVVFSMDQIYVEYLIAYRLVREKCDCGIAATKRTVVKKTLNRNCPIIFCGKNNKACRFMRMEPLCDCQESAKAFI